ncbi:hypothetical protein AERO_18695, partial [Aeromicrobium fastidiosum]|uniref:hypothetical protein n=1 Tax=Aeromicrobium fastidiosum TaxID=52699 RepID=UPI0020235B3F
MCIRDSKKAAAPRKTTAGGKTAAGGRTAAKKTTAPPTGERPTKPRPVSYTHLRAHETVAKKNRTNISNLIHKLTIIVRTV